MFNSIYNYIYSDSATSEIADRKILKDYDTLFPFVKSILAIKSIQGLVRISLI